MRQRAPMVTAQAAMLTPPSVVPFCHLRVHIRPGVSPRAPQRCAPPPPPPPGRKKAGGRLETTRRGSQGGGRLGAGFALHLRRGDVVHEGLRDDADLVLAAAELADVRAAGLDCAHDRRCERLFRLFQVPTDIRRSFVRGSKGAAGRGGRHTYPAGRWRRWRRRGTGTRSCGSG